ncbi:MAG: tetratricopeptide repeat protein, partial [Anaerolineae bacterium]|nr:tetratricopeptide repeat protein [Anaerolineae bacterium]
MRVTAGTLPLISTKISIPRRRKDLLPRRRLVDFVHSHLDRKLLLISAPAGYGKTSLLTDVAHDIDLPVCWYTLDAFDRDFTVFLEYFVAAIASRFPAFGERSRTFLRETSDPGSSMYPLVATLVQEIYDTIPEYFYLVLDDHHSVEDQDQISTFLDLFVTYVDENCHLVLASRTLPALPNLSLLVARRQAAGLSIDELRFTPEEIQGLARQNYDLELSLEEAGKLADRTGGWITGLLLTTAHHWQKAQKEVGIPGRIGIDLYDYLSGQVLHRQPGPLRDFLLASSVLEELDPELCRSVLGVERPLPLMDQLRIRNLFVIEYEGEPDQLRYHDLFREFLRDTLRREDEGRYRELSLRAAAAYEDRGEWERAVVRYLALQRYAPVVDIIQRVDMDLYSAGRWETLSGWIDALPESIRLARPHFLLLRGKIHSDRGELDQALALCEQAEDAFRVARDELGCAHALAAKGHVLRFQGLYNEAIARSQEALRLMDADTADTKGTQAMAYRNIGLCSFRQGKLAKGQEALQQALRLLEASGASYDAALVQHDMGLGQELMGDLGGAEAHYRAALKRWRELNTLGPWSNTLNGLGVVYQLQGRYKEALETIEEALSKAQRAGDSRVEAFIWASLGDVYRDLGAYRRASEAYEQALEVARRAHVGFVRTYAHISLGHVSRLRGDLTEAMDQLTLAMELAREHHADY